MLLTHTGILHYGNMLTGEIKWSHDTHKTPYQALCVKEYVDVGVDGDTPYFYSPALIRVYLLPFLYMYQHSST